MPIFNSKNSRNRNRKNIVFMPQNSNKERMINRKPKKVFNFLSIKRTHKARQKKKIVELLKYLLILPAIFVIIMLAYFSLKILQNLRQQNKVYEEKNIIGLEEIPAFPQSEFIFENNMTNNSVSAFISAGKSAYRIIDNRSIDEVYQFYKKKLPDLGWTYIQTVPTGSEEMKSGMYWEKNGCGLRIYSKFKDIWYETVTKEEAETGLKSRVKESVERDLLLANQENQDLLPDYPWVAQIPKEFLITYRASGYENSRIAEFRRLGTESIISLIPIAKYSSQPLDIYLNTYISAVNQQDSKKNCIISSTILAYTQYSSALKSTVTCSDGIHNLAVVINPNNKVVYIIDSNKQEEKFFNTLFEQLKPSNTLTY